MVDLSPKKLLYIHPRGPKTAKAAIDAVSAKMLHAWDARKAGVNVWKGWHECTGCGLHSDNRDYHLPGGFETNSLCLHYLLWHRPEVPQSEIDKVMALPATSSK